ncbi:MAG: hypothetical protein RI894_1324 [Bacteroidota bacterium]|jgi:hypothetical protein
MYPTPPYHFTINEGSFLLLALLLFGAVIYRFGQLKGLPAYVAPSLFATKAAAALAYIAYHARIPDGGDAYHFFYYSRYIQAAFYENPHYYFRLLLGANDSFVATPIYKYTWQLEYWSDDDSYAILRFHAILRWFSGGFYTIHGAFMAVLLYFASRNIYTVLYNYIDFEEKKQTYLLTTAVFFVPSVWFWTGGIHKDGFIYIGLSLLIYSFHYLSNLKSVSILSNFSLILKGILGVFLLFLCRSYLLVALFPALFFGLFFGARFSFFNTKKGLQYIILLGLGLILFYSVITIADLPFLEKLARKQREFISEWGNLDFSVPQLAPTWASLLQNLPIALRNGLFQPVLSTHSSIILLVMGLEPIFLLLFSAFLAFQQKNVKTTPLTYFLLTYCLLNLLLVGLLTANIGTLIRYRSVALGLIPLLAFSRKKG